ncbi:hypothetical protein ACFQH6_01455 [Halobacteriaceae archaeon GCM10025711]
MLDKLGPFGIVGVLAIIGGIALIAVQSPVVAAGISLVLVGVGLTARSLVQNVMGMFGMA